MVRTQRTLGCSRSVRKTRAKKQPPTKKAGQERNESKPARRNDTNPQLELLLKNAPHYERSLPLPYELLMKIFHYLVDISDHPIKDLCNLAQVCETWRIIIVYSPSLWSRIDFNSLPITDGNFIVLDKLVNLSPAILQHVQEVSLKGALRFKDNRSITFLESLITAPNMTKLSIDGLDPQCRSTVLGQITRSIGQCRKLRNLIIKNTRLLFGQQRWLADHLIDNGKYLEELHLTSSLTSVSSQLFRAIASDYCPLLRVLDMSTCDFLNTRSFDAIQLAQNMPNLVILRVANVSFRRVHMPPEIPGLTKLEELSMPIAMRDADRDDALLATLTYGSERITSLDLRGSSISANALIDLPSYNVRELHIDDLCPLTRENYCDFIRRWQHSLEVLSLVKINCSQTVKKCLDALISSQNTSNIKEVDLESSDVTADDLRDFLDAAKSLRTINLSSCRSLPRGCKGRYSQSDSYNAQQLIDLRRRLGSTHSDSETEIDDENIYYRKKRRRFKVKRPDYYLDY